MAPKVLDLEIPSFLVINNYSPLFFLGGNYSSIRWCCSILFLFPVNNVFFLLLWIFVMVQRCIVHFVVFYMVRYIVISVVQTYCQKKRATSAFQEKKRATSAFATSLGLPSFHPSHPCQPRWNQGCSSRSPGQKSPRAQLPNPTSRHRRHGTLAAAAAAVASLRPPAETAIAALICAIHVIFFALGDRVVLPHCRLLAAIA